MKIDGQKPIINAGYVSSWHDSLSVKYWLTFYCENLTVGERIGLGILCYINH